MSSSTLSKRLNEACELDLLEVKLESTDYGSNSMYVLTGTGGSLRDRMEHMGILRTYDKIQTLEEELDESIEDLQGRVKSGELFRESHDFER